jgi:hypothetical protein
VITAFGIPARTAVATDAVRIDVLSNRADLVTGGDALVEVVLPDGVRAEDVRVDVDGRDVSARFAVRPNGKFEALLGDLADGPNVVTAALPDGTGASITITSHAAQGPVFSGPGSSRGSAPLRATDRRHTCSGTGRTTSPLCSRTSSGPR